MSIDSTLSISFYEEKSDPIFITSICFYIQIHKVLSQTKTFQGNYASRRHVLNNRNFSFTVKVGSAKIKAELPRYSSKSVHFLCQNVTSRRQQLQSFAERLIQAECDPKPGTTWIKRVERLHALVID